MTELFDRYEGRIGEWMTTSDGGRFFPLDPRSEDFTIENIANGLALDCRYGGQGRIDRYYSVAEHSYLMAQYAYRDQANPDIALATLLHDAPEGLLRDLPRATKHAVGDGYSKIENALWEIMLDKWSIRDIWVTDGVQEYIKALDRRIVPVEKAALFEGIDMPSWAYDEYKPLEGVAINCWQPQLARKKFLTYYGELSAKRRHNKWVTAA